MSFHHTIVWLDHTKAHIVSFNREEDQRKTITAPSHHPNANSNSADHSNPGTLHYFRDISEALSETSKILIAGPAQEKLAFAKYLTQHHPAIAKKLVGVETLDHPSDGQLLAYARKYFAKADLYH